MEEQAFLIANAAIVNGEPLWDDGQVWQVYIEEATGERTYVFVRFVQLGMVEAKTTEVKAGQAPTILLIEQWPSLFHVYEVQYRGPQAVQVVELVQRAIANDPRT